MNDTFGTEYISLDAKFSKKLSPVRSWMPVSYGLKDPSNKYTSIKQYVYNGSVAQYMVQRFYKLLFGNSRFVSVSVTLYRIRISETLYICTTSVSLYCIYISLYCICISVLYLYLCIISVSVSHIALSFSNINILYVT